MNDKAFWDTLAKWEDRIASHSSAKQVLDGLDPDLRKQLAALLVDADADLEMYGKKLSRPSKTFAKEAQRRKRMLQRKRDKILVALMQRKDVGDGVAGAVWHAEKAFAEGMTGAWQEVRTISTYDKSQMDDNDKLWEKVYRNIPLTEEEIARLK